MTVHHGVIPDTQDPRFAPFWEGTRNGKLLAPQCEECNMFVWPPRPICPNCYAENMHWTEVKQTGTLYTWTVVHHPTVDSMKAPYIVGVVEIDEAPGLRFLGNLWEADPAQLRVGLALTADFSPVDETCVLVNWK